MEKIGKDEKKCGACGVVQHLSQFHLDKYGKDGRHWRCKTCKNAFSKEHARLKKQFEKLAEYHGIEFYPKLRKGIVEDDIECDHCGKYKSPSIMFQNVSYYRKKEDVLFVCRECIARNSDDIALNHYQPVPYTTNKEEKEFEKGLEAFNKQVELEEKKEKEQTKQHWKSYLEDDGVDTGDIKDFDV